MRSRSAVFCSLLLACSSSITVQDAAVSDDTAVSDDVPARDTSPADASEPDAYLGECLAPVDCVLLPESCCGDCGQPARNDIDSVPRRSVDAQRAMACAEPVACPECAREPDPTLLPDCSMGSCTLLDLNPPEGPPPALSACESDSDCVIRAAECCECGSTLNEHTVVALNAELRGGYASFVCELESTCPPCEPDYPANLVASCVGEGPAARCTVTEYDR